MKSIKLTQGKRAWVDDQDFEQVNAFIWHAFFDGYNWYALTNVKKPNGRYGTLGMHRFIFKSSGKVDHRDGNGLNNCRSNLRKATTSENQINTRKRRNCTSRFKGVCWRKDAGKWQAQIGRRDIKRSLGVFDNELDAAHAYDLAAKQFYGTFAKPNY